jgi:hypothetical protein
VEKVVRTVNPFDKPPEIAITVQEIKVPPRVSPGKEMGIEVTYQVTSKHWKKNKPLVAEELLTIFFEGGHWQTLEPMKNDKLMSGTSTRKFSLRNLYGHTRNDSDRT